METLTRPRPEAADLQPDSEKESALQNFSVRLEGIKEGLAFNDITSETFNPKIDDELDRVAATADLIEYETLRKVSDRLGSNDGGWHENPSTGDRFYLKFYKDPNQARVEFISNEIYRHLGFKAAASELVETGDSLAIASAEIPGAKFAPPERQVLSDDVRSGCLTDIFLGNYDVAGLVYDNIVEDENGNMHRIDNGGSLTFRARGKPKDYPGHDIPEFSTMLDPQSTTGRIFAGITEKEFADQARHLVGGLSPEAINDIVDRSGVAGEAAETIRQGLVGRRQFIADRFGPHPHHDSIPDKPPQSESRSAEWDNKQKAISALRSSGILRPIDEVESNDAPWVLLNPRTSVELDQMTAETLEMAIPHPAKLVPVDFEDRHNVAQLTDALASFPEFQKSKYITNNLRTLDKVARSNRIPPDSLRRMVATYNARKYFVENPVEAAESIWWRKNWYDDQILRDDKDRPVKYSTECIAATLEFLNVVGIDHGYQSAGTNSDSISFFDPYLRSGSESQKKIASEQMGPIGQALKDSFDNDGPLLDLLNQNLRAAPETIVRTAREVEGFGAIFAGSTGTWEDYTLSEHTETVLRNYERSFADNLPPEIQTPLRLALLTHDIGKSEVVAQGFDSKVVEHRNNLARSMQFLEQIGVDQAGIAYIHGLFEAADLYFRIYVHYDGDSFDEVRDLGYDTLSAIGIEPTPEAIEGFLEATSILFACDGGAYTSMATTRMPDGSQYRNHPAYDNSFKTPRDPEGMRLELKYPHIKPAGTDQQPGPEAIRADPNEIGPTEDAGRLSFEGAMSELITQETMPGMGEGLRKSASVICGGEQIENQEITLINSNKHNCLDIDFKLTDRNTKKVLKRLRRQLGKGEGYSIVYKGADKSSPDFYVGDCYRFEYNNMIIKVAKPLRKADMLEDMFKLLVHNRVDDTDTSRSIEGLVQIEIPHPVDWANPQQVEEQLNGVLIDLLGISGGLRQPNQEQESKCKLNRYAWWLNKDPKKLTEDEVEMASRLKRQKIISGYSTLVDENKTPELEERYGRFAPYHQAYSSGGVVETIMSGGLLSSQERYSRGAFVDGLSTVKDFHTGGADSVFTRTFAEQAKTNRDLSPHEEGGRSYFIIMDPNLYNRTDFYSYPKDLYGSTAEVPFRLWRQSPDEVLEGQVDGEGFKVDNEQMFRTGIPTESFQAIACFDRPSDKNDLVRALVERQLSDPESIKSLHDAGPEAVREFINDTYGIEDVASLWRAGPDAVRDTLDRCGIEILEVSNYPIDIEDFLVSNPRMKMIDKFRRSGITTINGIPVEEFVVHADSYRDFVDIAHERQARSSRDYGPDEIYDLSPMDTA